MCVVRHTHVHVHVHAASGEVFTWGSGSYGRLGHGNLRDRFSPLMIGGILRGVGVTFIACHEFHSLAVSGEEEEREEGRGREEGGKALGERVGKWERRNKKERKKGGGRERE